MLTNSLRRATSIPRGRCRHSPACTRQSAGVRIGTAALPSEFFDKQAATWRREQDGLQSDASHAAPTSDVDKKALATSFIASAIDETMDFFAEHGIPFEKARDARQHASHAHNQEETPNFAKSIERRALAASLDDSSSQARPFIETAKELLQAYIAGTAQESAALFAEKGALELPYLADLGVEPRYEGPKNFADGIKRSECQYSLASIDAFPRAP